MTVIVGIVLFVTNCLEWYDSQQTISISGQASAAPGLVTTFYLVQAVATTVMLIGMYLTHVSIRTIASRSATVSVLSILSDAYATRRFLRMGILAAVFYGLIYAFVSGVIVYQPTVNFSITYGVTAPTWYSATCCGAWGTVPALIFYIAPQFHLAFQFIPLNALFVILLPILVGANVAVAAYSLRSRGPGASAKWIGSVGAVVGFFTGCPTCAGLFFASAFAGLGGPSIAVALAPFQSVFVAVSIPLLLATPVVTAVILRRSMYAACRLPRMNSS
jgi:hypothetical protein